MKHALKISLVLASGLFLHAQDPETPPAPEAPQTPAAQAVPVVPGPGRGATDPEPRPYDRVITKDAKTSKGVFTVHQIRSRFYYEIPTAELGKDFLLVSQIARTTIGAGYGGQFTGSHVVRWERRENRIFLREVSFEVTADAKDPIAAAVEAAKNPSILMAFNIEAIGKDNAPVIEVTRLFSTDVPELSARARLRARGMDGTRSFVDHATAFPENVEVEATHTYTSPTDVQTGPNQRPAGALFSTAMRPGSGTVVMHFSMVKLPEQPMMPRLFDERVGFFTTSTMDYSRPEHRAERRSYIARWRLEKKDPGAALSEPVKPIVYYIDPATPKKWVPYLKRAIESWQPAFESAGFKNAIVAKEAPTPQEDPNWSADDVRHSVVRWLPSTVENASGPHLSDPRTGEILNADIQFYHNVMQLARNWYFVQVSPLDSRAQKLPLPDDLMGDLLTYILAHEVGHTLGLEHNMKASSLYPPEKLRDPQWLKTMGYSPSIMDYARFNYVAQPEDKVDPKDLLPKIGPYDIWAIAWGYKPMPAQTPDEEKKTLDEWARQQDKTPWLRFSTAGSRGADPGENTEAVGDMDAIYSTGLGLKNLNRVMNNLLAATTHEGDDWEDLSVVYGRVLQQWERELGHVAQIVGGVDSQEKHGGQEGVRFTPVAKDRQAAAVKFLNENAFATPTMFLKPEVLRRMEPNGTLDRIKNSQMRVLTGLLTTARIGRLVEEEAIDGTAAYRPVDFLNDVRKGVFQEIYSANPKIDAYRRNLQRGYLDLIAGRLNGAARAGDDERPLLRGELHVLAGEVAAALGKTTDRNTKLHLEDLRDQVGKILDPKFQQGTGTVVVAPVITVDGWVEAGRCWPED